MLKGRSGARECDCRHWPVRRRSRVSENQKEKSDVRPREFRRREADHRPGRLRHAADRPSERPFPDRRRHAYDRTAPQRRRAGQHRHAREYAGDHHRLGAAGAERAADPGDSRQRAARKIRRPEGRDQRLGQSRFRQGGERHWTQDADHRRRDRQRLHGVSGHRRDSRGVQGLRRDRRVRRLFQDGAEDHAGADRAGGDFGGAARRRPGCRQSVG